MSPRVTFESEATAGANLSVRRLRGSEAIGQLFRYELELAELRDGGGDFVNLHELVGSPATITYERDGIEQRIVHGIVTEARERSDESLTYPTCELTLMSAAWRLSQIETQEVFLQASVIDIIEAKLARHGLGDLVTSLSETYPPREFTVQYRETDLAFVSRLAEHHGLSFYFDAADGQTMVLTDGNFGMASAITVPFRGGAEGDGVFDIATRVRAVPSVYVVYDYNYRNPDVDLTAVERLDDGGAGGVVEYGTHHKTPGEGARLARVRAEEGHARRVRYEAKSTLCGLSPGMRIELDGHPRHEGELLLITEVTHEVVQPLGFEEGAEPRYENTFVAVPLADYDFRPARVTPKPRIAGVLSAVVQPGPGGEVGGVAKLDAQGRYTVLFHFDNAGLGQPVNSRPVRMAQPFAGAVDGMHFPLRPGVEVLITFVDGDPDRPIIIGAVPNTQNPSPVTSHNAHQNRIVTETGILIEFGKP